MSSLSVTSDSLRHRLGAVSVLSPLFVIGHSLAWMTTAAVSVRMVLVVACGCGCEDGNTPTLRAWKGVTGMANSERVWVVSQTDAGQVEPDIWAYRSEAGAWRKAAELMGVAGSFEPGDYQRVVEAFNREECYRGCEERGEECDCDWADEGNRIDVAETSLED